MHEHYMRQALLLAREAAGAGEVPVGCVIVRDGVVIHEGSLASLQRFKDSVKEVAAGYECGITFEKFQDIKEGDIIEAFLMEQIEV